MSRYSNRRTVPSIVNEQILLGDGYAAGELFGSVADGNTKRLVVENPTSDTAIFVYSPEADAPGQIFTTVVQNVTVDTRGASAVVTGKRTDRDSTAMRVTTAGDNETGVVSGGDPYPTVTAGGGSNASNASPSAGGSDALSSVVAPGDNLVLEAQNQSGTTTEISLLVDYTEVPADRL